MLNALRVLLGGPPEASMRSRGQPMGSYSSMPGERRGRLRPRQLLMEVL